MEAEDSAKEALAVRNQTLREYAVKILDELDYIQIMILDNLINAMPDAREQNRIFRQWNPMLLDLTNGLHVFTQGMDAADEIIKG